MGVFDKFADSPDQIRKEGQEISIKFQRTSDTTARISWNIPPPSAGCSATDQAYDGIVVTLASRPANYLTTSPVNATYYSPDPTADADLHAGDVIDTALVIGAFYHDKTTTILDISGIQPRTPYYVSGYAVDKVGRYHREGVHAYSIPTGAEEIGTADKVATHDITIDVLGGVQANTPTGLLASSTYSFKMLIDTVEYTIMVPGVEALTYGNLVTAINRQFALLESPYQSPDAPGTNGYYYDTTNNKLYQWNGTQHIEHDVIVSENDPSSPTLGMYWYDTDDKILYIYESGGWVVITAIKHNAPPNELECGQLWFDGVDAWKWDGNHWCKLCIFIQTRNPALGPLLSCNTYWFDTAESVLMRWDETQKRWFDTVAIYSTQDPNTLNTGDFWYNETTSKMHQFIGGVWNEMTNVRYEERNDDGDLDNPVASLYWFVPTEEVFYRRDTDNLEWVLQSFTSFPTDPRDRSSCDLWWNSNASINDLFSWDILNEQWVAVETFYKAATDPSLPPSLEDCAVWYNPDTDTLKLIKGVTCDDAPHIFSAEDPANLSVGTVWFNTLTNLWYTWDGAEWVSIAPITSPDNPYSLTTSDFWFRVSTGILSKWNGSAWETQTYSSDPLTPTVGTLWYNTVDKILLEWNGSGWVPSIALAGVELLTATSSAGRAILSFFTRTVGCTAGIQIIVAGGNLFTQFSQRVIYNDPIFGASGLVAGPTYKQLGVGDDGSPDERRALHDSIRVVLGHPVVQVELTKEQLDECINNALMELRKQSSYSYTRGFFFLDLKPNQQTYIMTNKCVGFNKVVDITSMHRMKGGAFRGALMNNDIHAYAALQQLYTLGTFDILTYHLASSYMEELETLFASRIMFQWVERTRELRLMQTIAANERILVDATFERTEQELLVDRHVGIWLKKWAIAEAKLMLSQIRGKFQTLPGPSGSTTLNSQELISQAEQEKQELRALLEDMTMQDAVNVGMRAHFIMG